MYSPTDGVTIWVLSDIFTRIIEPQDAKLWVLEGLLSVVVRIELADCAVLRVFQGLSARQRTLH